MVLTYNQHDYAGLFTVFWRYYVQFASAASDLHLCKAPGSRSESQVCRMGLKNEGLNLCHCKYWDLINEGLGHRNHWDLINGEILLGPYKQVSVSQKLLRPYKLRSVSQKLLGPYK